MAKKKRPDAEKGVDTVSAAYTELSPEDAEKVVGGAPLVVSTVQVPPPDAGYKVMYSLDKVDKTTSEPDQIDKKDVTVDLIEPTSGEVPTGYYKMNVILTPHVD